MFLCFLMVFHFFLKCLFCAYWLYFYFLFFLLVFFFVLGGCVFLGGFGFFCFFLEGFKRV